MKEFFDAIRKAAKKVDFVYDQADFLEELEGCKTEQEVTDTLVQIFNSFSKDIKSYVTEICILDTAMTRIANDLGLYIDDLSDLKFSRVHQLNPDHEDFDSAEIDDIDEKRKAYQFVTLLDDASFLYQIKDNIQIEQDNETKIHKQLKIMEKGTKAAINKIAQYSPSSP